MSKITAESTAKPFVANEGKQVFKTEGLQGRLERRNPFVRLFLAIIAMVERMNLRFSKVGNPSVYDNAVFPWAEKIESEWKLIRKELDNVLVRKDDLPSFHDIAADVSSISQDHGWKTFLLTGYGIKSERNIALCPETWRIVQAIPGLKTAMFSIFEPGKHLPAHRGPYNGVLRLHLGLIVPEPRDQVAIRVGERICHWEEGKVIIFDDAYEHEAWNKTDKVRVVLFVDFVKPLRFPASLLNWLILNIALFTPYIREGYDKHRRWERKFYQDRERS
ncbi:MAG TPA: aspartyl/asparaginyl beta-hydroxylase domain-containing protein [Hyphomicrobiales bacterium]|nr:aspartyl/asparaginyl beta-hydroxylase domain-containing protein [Hyphomicrobiales bacterium]